MHILKKTFAWFATEEQRSFLARLQERRQDAAELPPIVLVRTCNRFEVLRTDGRATATGRDDHRLLPLITQCYLESDIRPRPLPRPQASEEEARAEYFDDFECDEDCRPRWPMAGPPLSTMDQFLLVLLSIDHVTGLRKNYSEDVITRHMKTVGYVYDDFSPHSSLWQLPLVYDSHQHYKHSYLPLMLYDAWANIEHGSRLIADSSAMIDVDSDEEEDEDEQTSESDSSDEEDDDDDEEEEEEMAEEFMAADIDQRRNRPYNLYVHELDDRDANFITLHLRANILMLDSQEELFRLQNWVALLRWPADDDKEPTSARALGYIHSYRNNLLQRTRFKADIPELVNPRPVKPERDESNPLIQVEYQFKLVKSPANRTIIPRSRIVFLYPVDYIRPTIRHLETLDLMEDKPHFEQTFLTPNPQICRLDSQFRAGNFYQKADFNHRQQQAIVGSLNAVQERMDTSRLLMIQGPPGTGKSSVLVGIVKNLFENCANTESEPLRILICAPSNGAIDEVARRFIREQDFIRTRKLKIIRMGREEKVHRDLRNYSRDYLAWHEGGCRMKNGKRLVTKRMRIETLLEANLFFSTLNSCQEPLMLKLFKVDSPLRAFRCVIVDEASQCTEPELLMPMVYPTLKLILIGDHLQLPATVISHHARMLNYGRSMFERLYRNFQTQQPSSPVLSLQDQYRMHQDISHFPSFHFYEGALRTSSNIGIHLSTLGLRPYTIFDLIDSREDDTLGAVDGSKCNRVEAQFVLRLVLAILARRGIRQSKTGALLNLPHKLPFTLGVITFYRGQKDELIRVFRECHPNLPKLVDINTVDAFQGQERDIVILSCVRTRAVGFVQSSQRMNVALTRAKSSLIICLHAAVFSGAEHWCQLLRDARSRGRFFSTNMRITDQTLDKRISA